MSGWGLGSIAAERILIASSIAATAPASSPASLSRSDVQACTRTVSRAAFDGRRSHQRVFIRYQTGLEDTNL
jgi:hypothetical protein